MSTAVGIPEVPPKNTLLLLLFCELGFLILASIAILNLHRSKNGALVNSEPGQSPINLRDERASPASPCDSSNGAGGWRDIANNIRRS
jgi:hypothetical protein